MTEMIVDGDARVIEEGSVSREQTALVIQQLPQDLLVRDAPTMIRMMEQLVFVPSVPPDQQLATMLEFTNVFIDTIQHNMIALGFAYYQVQQDWEERYQGAVMQGGFDDWVTMGVHQDLGMIKGAIKLYRAWSRARLVQEDDEGEKSLAEKMISNPPSPKKLQLINDAMRKHEDLMERMANEPKMATAELEENKQKLLRTTRTKIDDILEQPDSVLIKEENHKNGQRDRIKLYGGRATWNEEDTKLYLEGLVFSTQDTDLDLNGQLRLLYEDTKAHWRILVRVGQNGQTLSLKDLADERDHDDGAADEDEDEDEEEYLEDEEDWDEEEEDEELEDS